MPSIRKSSVPRTQVESATTPATPSIQPAPLPSPFGVSPFFKCSLPPLAAGLDQNARQFYGVAGNVPQQRLMPAQQQEPPRKGTAGTAGAAGAAGKPGKDGGENHRVEIPLSVAFGTALIFTDNFNRADGPVGANWSDPNSAVAISSNHLVKQTNFKFAYANTVLALDSYVQAKFISGSNPHFVELLLRTTSTVSLGVNGEPQLYLEVTADGSYWYIDEEDGGDSTLGTLIDAYGNGVLGTGTPIPIPGGLSANDVLRLEARGTKIRFLVNGALIWEGDTPTAVPPRDIGTAFHAGVSLHGDVVIDDFECGNLISTQATGLIHLGRTVLLESVHVPSACRVRLYSTTAARDADLGRSNALLSSVPEGLIFDLSLSAGFSGGFPFDWNCRPIAPGADMRQYPAGDVAYTIDTYGSPSGASWVGGVFSARAYVTMIEVAESSPVTPGRLMRLTPVGGGPNTGYSYFFEDAGGAVILPNLYVSPGNSAPAPAPIEVIVPAGAANVVGYSGQGGLWGGVFTDFGHFSVNPVATVAQAASYAYAPITLIFTELPVEK